MLGWIFHDPRFTTVEIITDRSVHCIWSSYQTAGRIGSTFHLFNRALYHNREMRSFILIPRTSLFKFVMIRRLCRNGRELFPQLTDRTAVMVKYPFRFGWLSNVNYDSSSCLREQIEAKVTKSISFQEQRKDCDINILSHFWKCDFHSSALSVLGKIRQRPTVTVSISQISYHTLPFCTHL